MSVKRWYNAICDFEMSLHHGYPDGHYKLHHKIGQCFVKLKKYQSATRSFNSALDTLNSSDVDSKVRAQFTKILKECIAKFSAKPEERSSAAGVRVSAPHSVDPRLHESVEILEEVGKGRTAFARSNIGVGTIIALDEAMGEVTMVCSPTLTRRAQEPTSTLTTRARRCSTVSSASATCPSPTRVRSARGTCHVSRATRHLVMCQGGVLLQEVPGPGPGVQPQVPVSGRRQQQTVVA